MLNTTDPKSIPESYLHQKDRILKNAKLIQEHIRLPNSDLESSEKQPELHKIGETLLNFKTPLNFNKFKKTAKQALTKLQTQLKLQSHDIRLEFENRPDREHIIFTKPTETGYVIKLI